MTTLTLDRVCDTCARSIPAHSESWWNPQSGQVVCVECREEAGRAQLVVAAVYRALPDRSDVLGHVTPEVPQELQQIAEEIAAVPEAIDGPAYAATWPNAADDQSADTALPPPTFAAPVATAPIDAPDEQCTIVLADPVSTPETFDAPVAGVTDELAVLARPLLPHPSPQPSPQPSTDGPDDDSVNAEGGVLAPGSPLPPPSAEHLSFTFGLPVLPPPAGARANAPGDAPVAHDDTRIVALFDRPVRRSRRVIPEMIVASRGVWIIDRLEGSGMVAVTAAGRRKGSSERLSVDGRDISKATRSNSWSVDVVSAALRKHGLDVGVERVICIADGRGLDGSRKLGFEGTSVLSSDGLAQLLQTPGPLDQQQLDAVVQVLDERFPAKR